MKQLSPEEREKIRAEVAQIESTGPVTPARVVEYAQQHPDSALHRHFTWDINEAAMQYWLQQARSILSIVVPVTTTTTTVMVPMAVRDPRRDSNEAGYVTLPELLRDGDLAREALMKQAKMVDAHINRLRSLAQALNLAHMVDPMLDQLQQLRNSALQSPQQQKGKRGRGGQSPRAN